MLPEHPFWHSIERFGWLNFSRAQYKNIFLCLRKITRRILKINFTVAKQKWRKSNGIPEHDNGWTRACIFSLALRCVCALSTCTMLRSLQYFVFHFSGPSNSVRLRVLLYNECYFVQLIAQLLLPFFINFHPPSNETLLARPREQPNVENESFELEIFETTNVGSGKRERESMCEAAHPIRFCNDFWMMRVRVLTKHRQRSNSALPECERFGRDFIWRTTRQASRSSNGDE